MDKNVDMLIEKYLINQGVRPQSVLNPIFDKIREERKEFYLKNAEIIDKTIDILREETWESNTGQMGIDLDEVISKINLLRG